MVLPGYFLNLGVGSRMPIKQHTERVPEQARKVFRLATAVALSLTLSYGFAIPLPYLAPLLTLFITVVVPIPLGLKRTVGLVVLLLLTMGIGLILVPLLQYHRASGILLVICGIFLANHISINLGKGLVGMLLIVGLCMITAAGFASLAVATAVIEALLISVILAVVCQQVAYLSFPIRTVPSSASPQSPVSEPTSIWATFRATVIIVPAWLLALTNPTVYMPLILKSLSLGQQGSVVDARRAGRELLGSIAVAGLLAIGMWFALKVHPTLWLFSLLMWLIAWALGRKVYGVSTTSKSSSFWLNVGANFLILFGPAVQDSANGNDVYKAFTIRFALFFAVTLYAWAAVFFLEKWRDRRLSVMDSVASHIAQI